MPDVPRLGSGIPLVARLREMDRLRAAFSRSAGGTAGAVLIAGDAGIGKTRMVEEISTVAAEQGALVLSGRCVDVGETGLPYLPFAEALTQLRATGHEDALARPALRMLLPDLLESGVQGEVPEPQRFVPNFAPTLGKVQGMQPRREQDIGQLRLFDAVHGLLGDLAGNSTVLLVIEDLHWADSSTRGLLSFLISRLRGQRLLVLCTYRTDDLHRRHPLRPLLAELVRLPTVERLELPAFDKSAAREFVDALAEGGIEADMVRKVADQSEGNAFFAEELLAAFADDECGLPSSLADVLLSRVERLSEAAQQVIRLASVAGRTVKHSSLREVGDLDDIQLEQALREAVQHHIFVTGGEQVHYSFRHALMREAVYGDLLPGERVRLHASYARYLQERQDERGNAAAFAYHSMESNALSNALAASVRAAKEASQLGAPGEALRHLEQALRLWDAVGEDERPADSDELTLLRKASWAAGTSGHPERAIAYARSAVKVADRQCDHALQAEVRRRLAQTLMAIDGSEDEARTTIEAAWVKAADLPPSPTRAWVLAVYARMLRATGEMDMARERAELAIEDARAVGATGAEADALTTLAIVREAAGDIAESQNLLLSARDRATEADAVTVGLRARFYHGLNRYEQGLLDEAAAVLADGMELARQTGLSWSDFGVELRVLQMLTQFAKGDWDAVDEPHEQARGRVSSMISARIAACCVHMTVGRGRFADAERTLAGLRSEWRELQIAWLCGEAGAELAMWRGKPELAIQRIDEVLDWVTKVDVSWPMVGIKLGAMGTAAAADAVARAKVKGEPLDEMLAKGEQFAEYARKTAEHGIPRSGGLGPDGRFWRVRAEAELTRLKGASAPAAWAAVVEAADYGAVYDQAMARWRYAEALLGADRRDEAATQLRLASKTAVKLGAKPLQEALAQLARRARLSLAEDGSGPRDTVDLFTPREQSVLRLVALGQTNRQVGEELYISEKTVSVHLSRIMAKLGASRRAEAVAIAYDRGLLE
ncbi:LuxR family transcriptional regulator [Kibdelosporangium phytohabitans]|uniref:LuxR family transcriptional regulator n=1 Tax=Kibdelosporangium phytohabitans TaxID=860235 RepID=A0A0N9IC25_9PSEU|nr:helix-turn-helix transcriptional regulator [Kibdelosporangium phytohabitans]ALG12762.1 LuxR family transcriptional regulator [Kibdelosporangium phytohabitans]